MKKFLPRLLEVVVLSSVAAAILYLFDAPPWACVLGAWVLSTRNTSED